MKKDFSVEIQSEKMLAALNHPYSLEEGELYIPFDFKEKESSVSVIVLPNEGSGITIKSSTAEIIDAKYYNGSLRWSINTDKHTATAMPICENRRSGVSSSARWCDG